MLIRVSEIEMRIHIANGQLVINVWTKDHPPQCEVYDVDPIPAECSAWINILENKA